MELSPEMTDYLDRMNRSMVNDFFHGPESLKTEAFMRIMRNDPMPQEEMKRKMKYWEDKHKEIWDGYSKVTTLELSTSEGKVVLEDVLAEDTALVFMFGEDGVDKLTSDGTIKEVDHGNP